ncbi:alpha-ribazole phosphatase [Clostridium sediminicola]|uniref:alpha-ribazole phosphatase n=1 Tax=Clostridium sediminicola TaxID=3114879 RepID=UPI0031F205DC
MNIFLVRHGETNENNNKVYYGNIDVSLNHKGKDQMIKTAEYLKNIKFDKIFISERKRTEESAIIISGSEKELIADKRINELNFGDFEGKSYEQLLDKYPEECTEWSNNWKEFRPPNGESYIEMYNRVENFILDLEKEELENILIVAHSGVMRTFFAYIMDGELNTFWKFSSHNGSVATIKYEYGNWYIDEIRNP